MTSFRLFAALIVLVSCLAVSAQSRDVRIRNLSAVVQLVVDDGSGPVYAGSGTFVSSDGYVLTSYHVVEEALDRSIAVLTSDAGDLSAEPELRYLASVVVWDAELDLAILRVTDRIETRGGQFDAVPVDDALVVPSVTVGSSSSLIPGDAITVAGFPGVSGDTVTVTGSTCCSSVAPGRSISKVNCPTRCAGKLAR